MGVVALGRLAILTRTTFACRLKNGLLRITEIGFALPRTARNGAARTARERKGADHERAWRVEQIA
jgi:hypothetical protein